MKKINCYILTLVLFLIFCNSKVKSQERTFFFDPNSSAIGYSIYDIRMPDWKTVSIAIIEQGEASSLRTTNLGRNIKLVSGVNHQRFNRLSLYALDLDGTLNVKQHVLYTPDGDTIVAGSPPNNRHDTYSHSEISEEYPGIFKKNVPNLYSYRVETTGVHRQSFTFDDFHATHFPSPHVFFRMPAKNTTLRHQRETPVFIDSVNHIITAILGEMDKSVAFNQFKSYEFTSYDQNNKICASFNLKFQYPRGVINQSLVTSKKSGEVVGKLFVFANRFGIGKKHRDPERNNFEIVYTNTQGELIFHKTLKLTEDPKGRLYIHGAFADEDRIYIHYNVFKEEEYVNIAMIDMNGNATFYSNLKPRITSHDQLIKGGANSTFNLSRERLSMFEQVPGLNWGVSSKFVLNGARQLESELIVWGQMVYSQKDPNFNPGTNPDGTPRTVLIHPEIHLHGELIFFRYDSNFQLINTMVQELEITRMPSSISLIDNLQNKAYFFIPIPGAKVPELYKTARSMYDRNNEPHVVYRYNEFFNPMFIEFGEKSSNKIIRDTYLLDKHGSVFARKDLAAHFIVCGFGIDDSGKHFFKVNKLNF